jgi:serine/threonine protein kinase/WD40 repeat protein
VPPELARSQKYRILSKLGQGGMGTVYKAEQVPMTRTVAIKVMSPDLVDDPAALGRFQAEVRAAAQLLHPNIVTAFDADQEGGLHFLVMEHVEGITLDRLVRQKGPLPVSQACHFTRQAALALQHAHEKGMIHRDVKPQNLMVTRAGQVKVLDFGLARLAGARGAAGATVTGAFLGTPGYVAPEQAKDARSADIRADLYSLGCTLYFLLAGHPPFQADTHLNLILAHFQDEVRPLTELRGDLPAGLWEVVERLLAKDPAGRFQTPQEAARALQPFCGAGPKSGSLHRPSGPPPPAPPTVARTGVDPTANPELPELEDSETPFARSSSERHRTPRTRAAGRRGERPPLGLWVAAVALLVLLGGWATYAFWPSRGSDTAGATPAPPAAGRVASRKEPGKVAAGAQKGGRQAPPIQKPPAPQMPDDPVGEVGKVALGGEVRRLVWSRDGKRLLAACWDRNLYLFDMPTLDGPQTLGSHTDGANGAVFLPDKDQALSVGADKALRLWDVAQRSERKHLDGEMDVYTVALAEGGRWMATCGDGEVVLLWDLKLERVARRLPGHRPGVQCVAFTPKGDQLLSGDAGGTIRVWRVATGQVERTLEGHTGIVYNVRVTPDGRYAVSGGQDRTIRLWSLRSGRELKRYEDHTDAVSALALAPDGRRALSGGQDRVLRLWDLQTGKVLHRFEGHTALVWDVAFSPDGRLAVSGGGGGDRTVRLWRLPPAPVSGSLNITDPKNTEKWAVPTGDELDAGELTVAQWLREQPAPRNAAGQRALAGALLRRGLEANQKPGVCYAFLSKAHEQAVRWLDPDVAMQAVDEIDRRFRIDASTRKAEALERMEKLAGLGVAGVMVAECALGAAESAVAADNHAAAARLLRVARSVSVSVRNTRLQQLTGEWEKRLEAIRKEHEEAKAADKVLAADPANPAANLTVGRYQALGKGDWGRGLPHLAKGADAKLRAVAERDLDTPPKAAAQAGVADGWWNLAADATGDARLAMQRRGLFWYRQAIWSEAGGKVLAHAEGRVKELEKQPGVPGRWDHLDLGAAQARPLYVRIGPFDGKPGERFLSSREHYAGPVEVTVVARTEARNIRLYGPRGSCLVFNWEVKQGELRMHRPDGDAKTYSGSLVSVPLKTLTPRTWHRLQWRITAKGMEVSVNGALVFREPRKYELKSREPIRVGAFDSMVDVQSFVVRPLR